jgi:SAM-dependent methyltransferase
MEIPTGIDWKYWVDRWDRMQERYLIRRSDRFECMMRVIRATQEEVHRILDLGTGTGSLTVCALESFPEAEVYGVDMDPTLLPLVMERTRPFVDRVHLVRADFREPDWMREVPDGFDAVVSATSLHWLGPEQVKDLYRQIASLMAAGGVFLNADHVGSRHAGIQEDWEEHREKMRRVRPQTGDEWKQFWNAYLEALGEGAREEREKALGEWNGVEEGMPLEWHFDELRAAGFSEVDCFWRCDCDAVYGGILASER